jgi:multidrug efflux system membrane fusion protein
MPAFLPPSRHRWFLYGITILITIAGVWDFSSGKKKPTGGNRWGGGGPNPAWAGQGKTPAVPVRAVPAERRDLPVYLKAIGTVTPLNTVTVQSRVDGQLVRVAFTEGQWVEKGQLLAEIDPEPYRIRLAQAEGQLGQNLAQLQTARADFERLKLLYEKKLVTNQEMETQQALVREREGAMASDQAAVDNTRLQLAYTRIEAPIAGRLGLRRVDEGNLIRANTPEGLVVIMQTRPITVMSTVPEVDLPKVLSPLRAGEQLVVEAWDRTEQTILAR